MTLMVTTIWSCKVASPAAANLATFPVPPVETTFAILESFAHAVSLEVHPEPAQLLKERQPSSRYINPNGGGSLGSALGWIEGWFKPLYFHYWWHAEAFTYFVDPPTPLIVGRYPAQFACVAYGRNQDSFGRTILGDRHCEVRFLHEGVAWRIDAGWQKFSIYEPNQRVTLTSIIEAANQHLQSRSRVVVP
jgi:hypothetical protein